jgi:hypothetical protein
LYSSKYYYGNGKDDEIDGTCSTHEEMKNIYKIFRLEFLNARGERGQYFENGV